MSLAPGSRLGPYEIIAPLGRGGMGEVFTARDTRLNRLVAMQIAPGPNPSVYAFTRRDVQRNLFRIPLR